MRILTVLIASVFILSGCGSGTATVPYTGSTGTGTGTGYDQTTGTGYQYGDTANYGQIDDLPGGTFQALFGWDGRDYNVFLGLMIDPSNSYSACNPNSYANGSRPDSLRNPQTFASPNSDAGAWNPQAKHPPTMWNYNTDTGSATFVGYVRKNAQIDPDSLCR